LRAWLAARKVTEVEIEDVIALLAEAGAFDDRGFARRYAEDKRQLAGWGPDRIARSLQGRGVSHEHIEAALAGDDEGEQLDRAIELLAQRGLGCGSERERERALGLLVRRGYPLQLAYDAVRDAGRRSG